MDQKRLKLPIGIQSLAKLRENNCYYVDKTPLALKLIEAGSYFFLSRPRRFGKSLFLDTLKELFEGNQPLFNGLYAEHHWDWSQNHPVIRISFGAGVLKQPAELDQKIAELLSDNEQRLGCESVHQSASGRLQGLIRSAHKQTGQRAVVLIDEYDKPLLDNITDRETALVMREKLKNLYSALKEADEDLRFVFLTGVSKFSKVSLFSGLNNLQDITLDQRYSTICGYTDGDVDTVFAPELQGLNRTEIRHWYNGYHWLSESVYNPFDLLLLFDRREFQPYWFETGTPTFLVKKLAEHGFFTPNLSALRTSLELLSSFDVDYIAPEALLFQTGYLTLHKAEQPLLGHWVYTLGYPNHEVKTSLNAALLGEYTHDPSKSFGHRLRLLELLQANDLAGLKNLFQAFYASIPHDWYRNNPIAQYEGYYASVFYSYFAALGLDITLEDVTHQGRIDMTVQFNGNIYLFEFKVVELAPQGRAIEQLKAKNYAANYRALQQPIHLIGVEFSKQDRNISEFATETL